MKSDFLSKLEPTELGLLCQIFYSSFWTVGTWFWQANTMRATQTGHHMCHSAGIQWMLDPWET